MALPAGRYGVTKEQLRKIKRLPINTIGMITETKEGIAIVEDGATASQLITAGRQFWHGGKLYSADVDIAEGAAIVTTGEGKNASLMPSITDQLPGTDAEKANEVTIARVENGSTPSAIINADEQFYHSGILYTATQDIATTDTITPNTNCRVSDSVTGQIASKADKSSLGTAAYKNSTSVVTDSSDLVESGAVKDIVGWGNKNLVSDGITNVNIGGNGAISQSPNYDLAIAKVQSGVKYTMSKRTDFTDENIVYAFFTNKPVVGAVSYNQSRTVDSTTDEEWTITAPIDGYIAVRVSVRKKLQIEKGETATTYEPYHASVEESKADNSVIGTVEDGTNPTKSYAVDEFMVRDGAFCQVTAPVTTSSTWTEGSNYTKKSIAEVLQSLMS